jgi:hypothetical protein
MAGPTVKPYSMSTIKSRLLRPALTSNFICEFKPPTDVNNFLQQRTTAGFDGGQYSGLNQELIQLSCSEASLPGSSLATNEINNDYTGVTERHAYRRLYDDRADFTFYVDSNYYIIDFFENWISYVVGENLLTATNRSTLPQVDRYYNYRVNFPKGNGKEGSGYQTDNLYITKFERDHNRTDRGRPLTYQFINAYPISINSMPVSYDSSQLLKCSVSFTYSRYLMSRNPSQFASQNEEPFTVDNAGQFGQTGSNTNQNPLNTTIPTFAAGNGTL